MSSNSFRRLARFWRALPVSAASVGLWLVLGAACGSDANCTPGQSSPCSCPGGGDGAQVCDADGSGYGACVCGDETDGGSSDGGSRSEGGASSRGVTGTEGGATEGGAATGSQGGAGLVDYGEGQYAVTLSAPPSGTYCWYIEETVRICSNATKTERYRDLCYDDEPNCLARQPEDSETDTGVCSTRISYDNVSGGPLPGDCATLDAYWGDDPDVECLFHKHCESLAAGARCVDYKCSCPSGDCPIPMPGGGTAGSGAGGGGGLGGSGGGGAAGGGGGPGSPGGGGGPGGPGGGGGPGGPGGGGASGNGGGGPSPPPGG